MMSKRPFPCSRIAVRLWLMMIALVLLSVAFIWVAQVFLFERNYMSASIAQVQSSLAPVMEDLETGDLAYDDKLLFSLSAAVNGKTLVLDGKGMLAAYSGGHPLAIEETDSFFWRQAQNNEEFDYIQEMRHNRKIIRDGSRLLAVEFGIPAVYEGKPAYAILYHSLDEVYTVLDMNRRQLAALSVILTLTAAVLALALSRRFVKPIHVIKDTVDSLAEGDLSATPGLFLNDEIGTLARSVERLGLALQRVDVLRKEVIANVSHELRSPLALIAGYAEMVRDVSWKDDAKRESDLNLIIREARRMSEMVSDIMDYSQFRAGYVTLKREFCNLCDIVESEARRAERDAGGYGVKVRLRSDRDEITAHVDPLKIGMVCRNLLNNAVNHTKEGETVTVGIEEREDCFRVSVANPGPPIPDGEREVIWERFQRGQHHGGRKQGTGIGLSIVSSVLSAHRMPYGLDCGDGLNVFWFECPKGRENNE
jgi:signal transduction histidine kinase